MDHVHRLGVFQQPVKRYTSQIQNLFDGVDHQNQGQETGRRKEIRESEFKNMVPTAE